VRANRKTKRSESGPHPAGPPEWPQLACFLRWALHGEGSEGSGDTFHRKIEIRCRECGEIFVKYAYEKTVRCAACRPIHRKLSQKVEE
jgi:ribosomal protein L37E